MHRRLISHSYQRVIPLSVMNRHSMKSSTSQLVCSFLGSRAPSASIMLSQKHRLYEKMFKDLEGGIMDGTRAPLAFKKPIRYTGV